MNKIAYLIIILAFSIDFITTQLPGGRLFRLAPEMLSAFVLVIVALRIGRRAPIVVSPKYLLFFVVFLLVIMAGVATNAVQPGAIFAGMLIYLRYIPFFLLPVVYDFSEEEIWGQIKLILGLSLLQFPIALFQRFVQFSGEASGDRIVGTLGLSSNLSIVLISCAAVVMGFYLKKYLSINVFFLIMIMLLIPTMINETTVSLFLIPLALIAPALFIKGTAKLKYLLQIGGIATVFLIIFVAVYNTYYTRWGGDVLSIVTEGKMTEYVYKGADKDSRTGDGKEHSEIGRVDSMIMPFKLIDDPVKLLMGHGMGNVSDIDAKRLQGEYIAQYGVMAAGMTTVSYLIWEIGLFGLGLSLLLLLMLMRDAAVLGQSDDAFGAIALGWTGVMIVMIIVLAYQNIIPVASVGMLMWYVSGIIASKRFRAQRLQRF